MGKTKNWTGERLETHVTGDVMFEHLHRYALALAYVTGKKVVDIACGEGYGSYLLAAKAASVTGIDIDSTVIQEASGRYKKDNLQFLAGSVTAIPLADQSTDMVVSFETLEHIEDHALFMQEIKRILVPGGLLILSTPDKKNYSDKTGYRNPFHEKELYAPEFSQLLLSVFKNAVIVNQQTFNGSLISGVDTQGFHMYKGDYRAIHQMDEPDTLYRIGLASDNELPPVSAGAFCNHLSADDRVKQELALLKKTASYRIGHFILYPLKFIRNIFNT